MAVVNAYWSDFTGTGTNRDEFRPTVFALVTAQAGRATLADLRTPVQEVSGGGRCIVFTNKTITPVLPARFMCAWPADKDTLVPDLVVNFVNAQLGTSFPLQTHTWAAFFRRLISVPRFHLGFDNPLDFG